MKAKTELILYQCLWMAGTLMRPSWRPMGGSFEEWSYRNGFLRQIQTLEEQGWLESIEKPDGLERIHRLTKKGYLRALGGYFPPEQWDRGWDGKWRMAIFDLPEDHRGLRNELRKQLRAARFGGLQGSVWISPDPLALVREQLKSTAAECSALILFEGTTCGGESTAEMVSSAWNFAAIKKNYEDYLAHLDKMPPSHSEDILEKLLAWGQLEKSLWETCLTHDPLLPRELWPEGYPGEQAWLQRMARLRLAGKTIRKEFPDY